MPAFVASSTAVRAAGTAARMLAAAGGELAGWEVEQSEQLLELHQGDWVSE